jgi:hypothetical protein
MDLLMFTSKYARCKVYKKYLLLFGCILFASITISCHKKIININSPQLCVTDSLNILYLNNTATNPELRNLLDSARYRVTFQFYHDSTGFFNLCGWQMKDTTGSFHSGGKLLHETSQSALSIAGTNISLGNIHIGKSGRDSLYADTNKPGFEYILFVPRKRIDLADGINNVVYDVYRSSALPDPVHPFVPLPANMIASIADPSPPHKAI